MGLNLSLWRGRARAWLKRLPSYPLIWIQSLPVRGAPRTKSPYPPVPKGGGLTPKEEENGAAWTTETTDGTASPGVPTTVVAAPPRGRVLHRSIEEDPRPLPPTPPRWICAVPTRDLGPAYRHQKTPATTGGAGSDTPELIMTPTARPRTPQDAYPLVGLLSLSERGNPADEDRGASREKLPPDCRRALRRPTRKALSPSEIKIWERRAPPGGVPHNAPPLLDVHWSDSQGSKKARRIVAPRLTDGWTSGLLPVRRTFYSPRPGCSLSHTLNIPWYLSRPPGRFIFTADDLPALIASALSRPPGRFCFPRVVQ